MTTTQLEKGRRTIEETETYHILNSGFDGPGVSLCGMNIIENGYSDPCIRCEKIYEKKYYWCDDCHGTFDYTDPCRCIRDQKWELKED